MTAFRFAPASEADFERLLDLRLRVMREHLERVFRFDPARARAHFSARFSPASMRRIEVGEQIAGCVRVTRHPDHVEIGFFYLEPAFQRLGLGRSVLDAIVSEHPDLPCRLEVLKESPASRFYERAGFVRTGEDGWDILYERPASWPADASRASEAPGDPSHPVPRSAR